MVWDGTAGLVLELLSRGAGSGVQVGDTKILFVVCLVLAYSGPSVAGGLSSRMVL